MIAGVKLPIFSSSIGNFAIETHRILAEMLNITELTAIQRFYQMEAKFGFYRAVHL